MKIWLEPVAVVVKAYGFTASDQRELLAVAVENIETIRKYWNDHLGL
jgi:hypothetical protein